MIGGAAGSVMNSRTVHSILLACALLGLSAGLALYVRGQPDLAALAWSAGTGAVLLALAVIVVISLARGEFGLDILAAISMSGALIVGEPLAGNVVALMFAGGQVLEDYAQQRAQREMTSLLARVPRFARRKVHGRIEEVPLDAIAVGDCLLIRPGDVVPVDGEIVDGRALLDQSALTGEAMPVSLSVADEVMSGSTNAGGAFDLRAKRTASQSTYAGIVRLVEAAQRSKAPMSRLADRYALGFLALSLALAGGTWLLTHDPVRTLAVLIVATPCPLILAVPVAHRRGHVALCPEWRSDQERQGAGATGAGTHPALRQDRHPDRRGCPPSCGSNVRTVHGGRGPRNGGVAGSGVTSRGFRRLGRRGPIARPEAGTSDCP